MERNRYQHLHEERLRAKGEDDEGIDDSNQSKVPTLVSKSRARASVRARAECARARARARALEVQRLHIKTSTYDKIARI